MRPYSRGKFTLEDSIPSDKKLNEEFMGTEMMRIRSPGSFEDYILHLSDVEIEKMYRSII